MNLQDWGPTTLLIVVAALIILGVGGVSVITNHLSYELYLAYITKFAQGVGLVAIGRGIYKHGLGTTTATRRHKS